MGIHLLPPLFKQVLEGGPKYGAETEGTFYPTSGTTGVAADGEVNRNGGALTWADVHDGAGNYVDNTGRDKTIQIRTTYGTGNYNKIGRVITSFDTRAIPAGSKIVSAVLSLYTEYVANQLGGSPKLCVVSATPANAGALVASDYGQLGTVVISNEIAWASLGNPGYNNLTLTETGLTFVKSNAVTSLGLRESTYDRANTAPPWQAAKYISTQADMVEYGVLKRPYLHVHWQPPL